MQPARPRLNSGSFATSYDYFRARERIDKQHERELAKFQSRLRNGGTDNEQGSLDRFLKKNGPQIFLIDSSSPHHKAYGSSVRLPAVISGERFPIYADDKRSACKLLASKLEGIASRERLDEIMTAFEIHYSDRASDLLRKKEQEKNFEIETKKRSIFGKIGLSGRRPTEEKPILISLPECESIISEGVSLLNEWTELRGELFRFKLAYGNMLNDLEGPEGVFVKIVYPTTVDGAKTFYQQGT